MEMPNSLRKENYRVIVEVLRTFIISTAVLVSLAIAVSAFLAGFGMVLSGETLWHRGAGILIMAAVITAAKIGADYLL